MSLGSDIYTKLKDDHDTVANLLQRLTATDTMHTAQRQALLAELTHHLTQHSDAENEVFYTRLLQHQEMQHLIRDGQHEHQRIETLLNELAGMDGHDPHWSARLQTLKDTVEHHVRDEEGPVFTQAKRLLTAQQAEELGQQFEHAKGRQTRTGTKVSAASYDAGTTSSIRETGERISHEAQHVAEEAKAKGYSMLREQQHFLAMQIGGMANALRQTAQHLGAQEQQPMAQYTEQAAAGLERFSRTLQEQDLNTLLSQVEDFARRQPVAFVGSAALLGFLAARFLKSSAELRQSATATAPHGHSHRPEGSEAGSSPAQAAPPPVSPPTGHSAGSYGNEPSMTHGG